MTSKCQLKSVDRKKDALGSSYKEKNLLSLKRIAGEVKDVRPRTFLDGQIQDASHAGGLVPRRVTSQGQLHMRQNRRSTTTKIRFSLPGMKVIIHLLL